MVEPKLALLEMQIKSRLGQTSKLCKAHFSDAPKVFDTVNMRYFISEFIEELLYIQLSHLRIGPAFGRLFPVQGEQESSWGLP